MASWMRLFFLAGCISWQFSLADDAVTRPWEQGQDLEGFYRNYCKAENLETHYFPSLDASQRKTLTNLLSEFLWINFSDYVLEVQGSSDLAKVIEQLRALKIPVSPLLLTTVRQARQEPTRSKYVHAHNSNLEHRENVLERFKTLALSSPELAGAMLTYNDCRTIRSVKEMDSFLASRAAQVKAMQLDTLYRPSHAIESRSHPDPQCACGNGNFCYGPRGGHYCITSGGKRRYVPH